MSHRAPAVATTIEGQQIKALHLSGDKVRWQVSFVFSGQKKQMLRRVPSIEELRLFAEEHLAYEINMLLGSANVLFQQNNSQFVTNACLECFTVHLRALIDFLWEPARLREDDAIADDFFLSPEKWKRICPTFPSELNPAKSRTGKEIVHLTYTRMKVTPETKGWNILEMRDAILRVLKLFAENADRSRIGKALENL